MPAFPALRFGQEVGELRANLGYIAEDPVSKTAKQQNWVFEVGGERSGLEAASEEDSPEILHTAEHPGKKRDPTR